MLRSSMRSGAEQLESWRTLRRVREEERRRLSRRTVHIPAKIQLGDSLLDCAVLDISANGARIVLKDPSDIPQFFSIFMTQAGTYVRQCRLVWQSNLEAGLEFVASESV
jgi:PilZ domain